MNLSFAGCGFLGIYHVGVASCFREYAPHALVEKIAGASAGALAASALICGVPLGDSTSDVLRVVMKARSRALGPFHPGFDLNAILYDGLNKMLPEDAHIRCSGALHISCTRVCDGENVLLKEFDSREHLIQALLCSCFIPFYSGIVPPKFNGVSYMDGGLSDNLPVLDDKTVTVSPFSGESDICPQDNYFNFLQINMKNTSIALSPNNFYRLARILFPPSPEVLTKMCQQGFDDALRFLQRNDLISCTRCLAIQSSFTVSEMDTANEEEIEREIQSIVEELKTSPSNNHPDHEYDDDCSDCRHRRQMAVYDSLPESVVTAIQEACDQLNKGVINWLFRHKYMKILSFLTVPYVLPFDITVVMISRILELLPKLRKEMTNSFYNLLAFTKTLISKVDRSRHLYSAKFSCQLAITEYNYVSEDKVSAFGCSSVPSSPQYQTRYPPLSNADRKLRMEDRSRSLEEVRVPNTSQRKSYAGPSNVSTIPKSRRQSMVENPVATMGPERVIKTMNFGFTMDIAEHSNPAPTPPSPNRRRSSKRQTLMQAFKSLDEGNEDLDVIELANKALNIERDYLKRSQPDLSAEIQNGADTFEDILDVANKQDALMAFYYMDETNRVKVTEIFNVTDADTSAVLAPEEREANAALEWDEDEYNTQDLGDDFEKEQILSSNVQNCSHLHGSRRRKSLENAEYVPRQQLNKVRRFGGQWDNSVDSQTTSTSFQSDSLLNENEKEKESYDSLSFETITDSNEFMKQFSREGSIVNEKDSRRRKSSFLIVE